MTVFTFHTSQIKKSNNNTVLTIGNSRWKNEIPLLSSVSNLKFWISILFATYMYNSLTYVWLLHNNVSLAHAPCSISWLILMEFYVVYLWHAVSRNLSLIHSFNVSLKHNIPDWNGVFQYCCSKLLPITCTFIS